MKTLAEVTYQSVLLKLQGLLSEQFKPGDFIQGDNVLDDDFKALLKLPMTELDFEIDLLLRKWQKNEKHLDEFCSYDVDGQEALDETLKDLCQNHDGINYLREILKIRDMVHTLGSPRLDEILPLFIDTCILRNRDNDLGFDRSVLIATLKLIKGDVSNEEILFIKRIQFRTELLWRIALFFETEKIIGHESEQVVQVFIETMSLMKARPGLPFDVALLISRLEHASIPLSNDNIEFIIDEKIPCLGELIYLKEMLALDFRNNKSNKIIFSLYANTLDVRRMQPARSFEKALLTVLLYEGVKDLDLSQERQQKIIDGEELYADEYDALFDTFREDKPKESFKQLLENITDARNGNLLSGLNDDDGFFELCQKADYAINKTPTKAPKRVKELYEYLFNYVRNLPAIVKAEFHYLQIIGLVVKPEINSWVVAVREDSRYGLILQLIESAYDLRAQDPKSFIQAVNALSIFYEIKVLEQKKKIERQEQSKDEVYVIEANKDNAALSLCLYGRLDTNRRAIEYYPQKGLRNDFYSTMLALQKQQPKNEQEQLDLIHSLTTTIDEIENAIQTLNHYPHTEVMLDELSQIRTSLTVKRASLK